MSTGLLTIKLKFLIQENDSNVHIVCWFALVIVKVAKTRRRKIPELKNNFIILKIGSSLCTLVPIHNE